MTTTPVRFEFVFRGLPTTFSAVHELPSSLICAEFSQKLKAEPDFANLCLRNVDPIAKSIHEARLPPQYLSLNCEVCHKQSTEDRKFVIPYLSPYNPHITIMFVPLCGDIICSTAVTAKYMDTFKALGEAQGVQFEGHEIETPTKLATCEVCDKKEGLMRCGSCNMVSYCGIEHQEEHWPRHELVCQPREEPDYPRI